MVVSRIQPNGPRGMAGHQPSTPPSGLTALGRRLGLVFSHTARTIGLYPIYSRCASARYRGLTGHNRSVDLSRTCKLQHSKYMSTCVSEDQSSRREMKQPPATTTAALKGGREAVSTDPSIETVHVLFFRLALKINTRGGRETEKLIIVP